MTGKGLTLAGFITLIAAIAANGEKALVVVAALPEVLAKFSGALPLGAWSAGLQLAVLVLVFLHADRRLHAGEHSGAKGRDFRADTLCLFLGVCVSVAQMLANPAELSAAQWLQGMMVGILVGLLAPLVGRGLIVAARNVRGATQ